MRAKTLFFDRCVGTRIPKALVMLRIPLDVRTWQQSFGNQRSLKDADWLPTVSRRGWLVVTFDNRFTERRDELEAIISNGGACFCLWGGSATAWDRFSFLNRHLTKVLKVAAAAREPFVFRLDKRGRVTSIDLDQAASGIPLEEVATTQDRH